MSVACKDDVEAVPDLGDAIAEALLVLRLRVLLSVLNIITPEA